MCVCRNAVPVSQHVVVRSQKKCHCNMRLSSIYDRTFQGEGWNHALQADHLGGGPLQSTEDRPVNRERYSRKPSTAPVPPKSKEEPASAPKQTIFTICPYPTGNSLLRPLLNRSNTVQLHRRKACIELLKEWPRMHQQHDVAELMTFVAGQANIPGLKGIWEARSMEGTLPPLITLPCCKPNKTLQQLIGTGPMNKIQGKSRLWSDPSDPKLATHETPRHAWR